jgi:hypothetical protein
MNRPALGAVAVAVSLIVGVGASVARGKSDDTNAAKRAAARQLIDAAIKEARLLSKSDEKATAYLSIADAQLKAGDNVAARQSVGGAATAASGIDGDTSSIFSPAVGLYVALAGAQAQTGDVAGAKATVGKIHDGWGKAAAYARIAAAQLQDKDVAGARQTVASAKSEVENAKSTFYLNLAPIYGDIIQVWAATGDIAGATAFVTQIPKGAELAKTMCYRSIAEAQAKAGDVAGAYQTIELARTMVAGIRGQPDKIFPDFNIQEAYAEIAKIQVKAGDVPGAKATLGRLQDVVGKNTAGQSKSVAQLAEDTAFASQMAVCLEIAAARAKTGDMAEARRNIAAAKAAAERTGPNLRAHSYVAVSQSQLDIGDAPAARETLAAAKAAVERMDYKIANPSSNLINKIYAYCSVMAAQAGAGDAAGARETLETARGLIPKFSPEYFGYKSWAYRAIADAQAAAGDLPGAKASAAQIQAEDDKDRAYRSIVAAQAAAGDAAGAIEFCARVQSQPNKRCEYLTSAAKELCSKP